MVIYWASSFSHHSDIERHEFFKAPTYSKTLHCKFYKPRHRFNRFPFQCLTLTRTLFAFPFQSSEGAFETAPKDAEFLFCFVVFFKKKSIHSAVKVRNLFHPSKADPCQHNNS